MKIQTKLIGLMFIAAAQLIAPAQSRSAIDEPVAGLIERIVPGQSAKFILEKIPADQGKEVFELDGRDGKIILRGSSSLALARALNWYLNYVCLTSVSWYKAEPIDVPSVLPPVREKVRKECRFEKRFFLNYCTFGYTTLWWQWDDWQRFIDWMALNGINMPLAITGEEYVWEKVWKKFGLTDDQIRAFFTGPAHLPWHRMGNLDGWLGPLPQSFIDQQFALQKQILERERSFGMTPVLPAFAGHTPKAILENYPKLKLTNLGSYSVGSQYDAFFLDPMEPLFVEIQKEFLAEQTKCFGTDHYYGTDPFNEMDPPSWDPDYLASVARTIYKGLSDVDKDAVWVQMGWTFYYDRKHWTNPRLEAMIKAVPPNKMMLLDYYCEYAEIWRTTDAFFNAPYIWCYLGNFGGGTQMAAPIKKVSKLLAATEADDNRRQMRGLGSTLEGFGVNRFMFEWLFEYAWDSSSTNVTDWIARYARTRAGQADPIAEAAWKRLVDVVYDHQVSGVGLGNTVEMRPRFEGKSNYTRRGDPYDYFELSNILAQMLLADPKTLENPRYQYDLAMVCRQVLANLAFPVRNELFEAFKAKDKKRFEQFASLFLQIESDVDRIVATRPEFSFDTWVADARKFAAPDAPADFFEKNAKVLVTTWGQQGNFLIDYAARDFSGLINNYYKKRWELYFDEARKSMDNSTALDQKAFDAKISGFEWQFCESKYTPQQPLCENAGKVARELYSKYVPWFSLLKEETVK